MAPTDELLITDADMPASAVPPTPPVDPAVAIENKVAPRVAEARLLKVIDQVTLNAVAERLAINKALQKEAGEIFDPVIAAAHDAHKKAIAGKKKVTDPLTQEEGILKLVCNTYLSEQERIERARLEQERLAREAEERRLLAEAEETRKRLEQETNERIQREHAEEVERVAQELEASGASAQEVYEVLETPAPAPVSIPLDIPVLPVAPVRQAPAIVTPKGMARRVTFKAEITNLTLLCRAIGEGKVPASYVDANMTKLNQRVRADEGKIDIPGVRAVEDSSISSRAR